MISPLLEKDMRFGLDNISDAIKALKIDLSHIKIVHVAGTNGKGSTCAMLHSLIKAHIKENEKTGLYTSPHLIKYNERFVINEEQITDSELKRYSQILEPLTKKIPLTFFEIATATAFMFFYEQKINYAVIETGLGGRLDATNIVNPEVAVITSIGIDHTEYLGNTLEEIASEKAGIFKKGCAAVISNTACNTLLKQKAKSVGVKKIYELGNEFGYVVNEDNSFDYTFNGETLYKSLNMPLAGEHQYKNAVCAITAFNALGLKGTSRSMNNALLRTVWPGRLEQKNICGKKVYLDISHNAEGVESTVEYFKKQHTNDDIYIACGFMKDKDYITMIERFASLAKKTFLIPTTETGRELRKEDYIKNLRMRNENIIFCDDYNDAVNKVMAQSGIILFTGSTYNYAQICRLLEDKIKCCG
ncbi:MAG: Mur ligase family protein [Pseudomonadota bacterium]